MNSKCPPPPAEHKEPDSTPAINHNGKHENKFMEYLWNMGGNELRSMVSIHMFIALFYQQLSGPRSTNTSVSRTYLVPRSWFLNTILQ